MLKTLIFGAAASVTALIALPAAAEAQYYGDGYYGRGYYDRGYYDRGHYRDYPRRYRRGDYYGGHRGYHGRRYYSRGYYGRRYRCGDGTTGAIIGGATGALLGREVGRSGRRYGRYGYRRGGDGTTGAIIGGAIGALVGREIDRGC